ncbi:hypothetical protein CQW23_10161 [Capsicum baccatum]|uniref:Protein kinase domain-containing protein n=1 Tax=Capsicum baccatum TaxID=33114 RepID=A0A2G2WYT8_CAPBA|nr:hypothetical protein CQW23_10161 [Capsicum baccatum]
MSLYLFKGPIPSSLSRLTSLEVLDLSYNRFSGQILDFLARMGGLTRWKHGLIHLSPVAELDKKGKKLSLSIIHLLSVLAGLVFGIFARICICVFYCIKKIKRGNKSFSLHSLESLEEGLVNIGHHSNYTIAPLVYVVESDTTCIFYGYPQHGTLFDLLHGICDNSALDWKSFAIVVGIYRGLAILHGGSVFSDSIILLHLLIRSIFMNHLDQPSIGDIKLGRAFNSSQFAVAVGYVPPALHTQYIFRTDVPHGGPAFHAVGTGASAHSQYR